MSGLRASSRRVTLALTLLAAGLVACAGSDEPRATADRDVLSGPVELVILHTNDIHGKFTTTAATWRDGNPPIGGLANLSAYVEDERAAYDRTMLVDAGDFMTGNPICDEVHEGVTGGAMVALLNLVGYDAICLGNHEFDHGLETLDGLMGLSEFPVVSANTFRPQGGLTAPEPYVIVEERGLRIGVIGLMTENLYGVAAPSKLAGTRVTSAAEAARSIVAEIDDETDLIVLLTHIGVDGDRELARAVENVDVIVGGHSHTRITTPELVNGVIIVQAGAHNRNLGKLVLTVENDAVTAHAGELIELWPREGGRPDLREMVGNWEEKIEAEFGRQVATLATSWDREYHAESNIGNWLCDRLMEHVDADFAVLNSGGIRKDQGVGPMTKLDVMEILPFANVVTTFTVTGEELLTIMRKNADAAANERYGILQVGGIRYGYREAGGGIELVDPTVGGEPVDPTKTYRGASVDYVAVGNAERYFGFVPDDPENSGIKIADVILEAVEATETPIDARVDGRMSAIASGRKAG